MTREHWVRFTSGSWNGDAVDFRLTLFLYSTYTLSGIGCLLSQLRGSQRISFANSIRKWLENDKLMAMVQNEDGTKDMVCLYYSPPLIY